MPNKLLRYMQVRLNITMQYISYIEAIAYNALKSGAAFLINQETKVIVKLS